MMEGLVFDPDKHQFTLDGISIPGVTRILGSVKINDYSFVNPEILADAAERGKNVHEITELYDKGILDYNSVNEQGRMYLDQWIHFKKKYPQYANFEGIEKPFVSRKYRYAGIIDRYGKNFILDIKTTVQPHPGTGIQLAAYCQMFREKKGLKENSRIHRIAVFLKPGKVFIPPKFYNDRRDWNVFLSALNVHKFKQEKGLTK